MTVPANLVSPLLGGRIPEITFNQVTGAYPGGGLSGGSVSMSLGTPKSDRRIIVAIVDSDGVPHNITGTPTLDGVAMVPLVQQNGVRGAGGVWIIDKPTGSSGTVTWTTDDGDSDGYMVATWSLYGASHQAPDFSNYSASSGASIPVAIGSCAVFAFSWSWQGGSGTFSSPLTADFTGYGTESNQSGGHGQAFSNFTVAPGNSIPYNGIVFVAAWK